MNETSTYSDTARIARELGATLDQANEARAAAMNGAIDGRMVYSERVFRAALAK